MPDTTVDPLASLIDLTPFAADELQIYGKPPAGGKKAQGNAFFTLADDMIIADALLSAQSSNPNDRNTVRSGTYNALLKNLEIIRKYGGPKTVTSLESRRRHLRKEKWEILSDLIKVPGFAWDKEQYRVIVNRGDETIWDRYTKDHPKAAKFRDARWPPFNKLNDFFNPPGLKRSDSEDQGGSKRKRDHRSKSNGRNGSAVDLKKIRGTNQRSHDENVDRDSQDEFFNPSVSTISTLPLVPLRRLDTVDFDETDSDGSSESTSTDDMVIEALRGATTLIQKMEAVIVQRELEDEKGTPAELCMRQAADYIMESDLLDDGMKARAMRNIVFQRYAAQTLMQLEEGEMKDELLLFYSE